VTTRCAVLASALLSACTHGSSTTSAGASDAASDSADAVADVAPLDSVTDEDTGPPFPCPPADYFMTVLVEGKTLEDLRHYCSRHSVLGDTNDIPAAYTAHRRGPHTVITACSAHIAGPAQFLSLLFPRPAWAITYYADGNYRSSFGQPATVVITRNEPIGGIVEGSYEGDVAEMLDDGGTANSIHVRGSFRVCHLPDHYFTE